MGAPVWSVQVKTSLHRLPFALNKIEVKCLNGGAGGDEGMIGHNLF